MTLAWTYTTILILAVSHENVQMMMSERRVSRPEHSSDGADNPVRDSRSPRSSRRATASLILGLCAVGACFSLDNPLVFLVACSVAGLPAIAVGLLGLREIKHANVPVLGKGNAIAGIVLGSLTTILTLLTPLVVEGREPGASRCARIT